MFALGTSLAIANTLFSSKLFVTHHGLPGERTSWLLNHVNDSTQILLTSLFAAAIFLQDAMLVRRYGNRILSIFNIII